MQLFIVRSDGEIHEIKSDKPFRELLDSTNCYIINDDDKKIIYLWKGSQSSVRSKFIGASKSQEIRGQVGMHYKVVPIEEGEEPDDLLAKLDEPPSPGLAREIRESKGEGNESTTVEPPKVKPKFGAGRKARETAPASAPAPVNNGGYINEGPLYRSEAAPSYGGGYGAATASTAAPPPARSAAEPSKEEFKRIMETLESLEIPEGYERDMIVIGNQAYTLVEKKVSFLGQERVEVTMEKIGSLPEGVFFAKGYTPRILCENQKVLAIEFLKKTK